MTVQCGLTEAPVFLVHFVLFVGGMHLDQEGLHPALPDLE
jgi:hypothetical protein